MNHHLFKQAFKNREIHDSMNNLSSKNIAQDSTHAKVTSPSFTFCKDQLEKFMTRKEKNAVMKTECEKWLPPQA
jgi:hypothetical protein